MSGASKQKRVASGRPAPRFHAKVAGLIRVMALGDRRACDRTGSLLWWRSTERRCRRKVPRRRVRLLSGKIVDEKLGFLIECALIDHSQQGCQLRLARDVPLPETFRVYLDQDASIFIVAQVWRRGLNIGLRVFDRLETPEDELPPLKWRSLGQPYYAV